MESQGSGKSSRESLFPHSSSPFTRYAPRPRQMECREERGLTPCPAGPVLSPQWVLTSGGGGDGVYRVVEAVDVIAIVKLFVFHRTKVNCVSCEALHGSIVGQCGKNSDLVFSL